MVKTAGSVFLIFVLFSCNVETRSLKNNKTKVPTDNQVFGNRSLFTPKILEGIATDAVYEEIYSYLSHKENFIPLTGQKNYTTAPKIRLYRFYPNGCVNFFITEKELDAAQFERNIDPDYEGSRGILYQKENGLKVDLFAIKSYGLKPKYGIITHALEIKGDMLFEKTIKDPSSVRVYVKKRISQKALAYKADW